MSCELSKPSNPVNLKLDQSAIEKDMQDYRSLPQNPVIQTGGDLLNWASVLFWMS